MTIVLLVLATGSAMASNHNSVVKPVSADAMVLSRTLAVWVDETGQATLADVMASPIHDQFQASDSEWPTFGISQGAVWTRAEIDLSEDPMRTSRRVQFSALHPDAADFFVVDDMGQILRTYRGGLDVPGSSTYRKFSMALGDLAATRFTLYARLTTHHVSTLTQVLITAEEETQTEIALERVLGPLYGAILMAVVYCFLLWAYLREAVYGYGFAFVANAFIATQPYINVDRLYWPPALLEPDISRAIYFGTIGLIPALGLLFTSYFLQVPRWQPRLHRVLSLASAIIVGAHIVVITVASYWFMPVMTTSLIGAIVLIGVTLWGAARAGSTTVRTYMFIALPVVACLVLTNFGGYGVLLQHPVWTAVTVIGLTFVAGGVSVALADGFRRNLESKVQMRTRELSAANAALHDAHEAKNRMLGVVAHDLRNPLSGIRAAAQLLLEIPLEPAKRETLLRTIKDGADLTLNMSEDLLDVASIEDGIVEIKPEPVDLGAVVRTRADLFRMSAQPKNIAIHIDLADTPPAWADAKRVGQALDNLVSNAVKYSPANGRVAIELRSDDTHARLSVLDQGIGIPPDELNMIFMPFRRASAQPTGGERSTGLGLAIVRRLMEAQGGHVSVQSTPSKGSRFELVFPLAVPSAAPSPRRTQDPERKNATLSPVFAPEN